MKFNKISNYSESDFRRLVGVKRDTFNLMLEEINSALDEKRTTQNYRGGRKSRLSLEDQLLLTLEYLREYRTQFHIGSSYGVSESTAGRIISNIENILIKSDKFSLPGKKNLSQNDNSYEIILIDATESPIERPKKNKKITIQARKNVTQ